MTGVTMQAIPSNKAWVNILCGAIVGLIALLVLMRFSKGKTVGDIADVEPGKVEVRGSELFVDEIYVANIIGTDNARELVAKEGMAVVIYPREDHFRITLDNFGQRQAILFEASRALGLKRYHFTRKDYEQGRIVIMLVPIKPDIDALIESVKKTPLLESTKKSHAVMNPNFLGRE